MARCRITYGIDTTSGPAIRHLGQPKPSAGQGTASKHLPLVCPTGHSSLTASTARQNPIPPRRSLLLRSRKQRNPKKRIPALRRRTHRHPSQKQRLEEPRYHQTRPSMDAGPRCRNRRHHPARQALGLYRNNRSIETRRARPLQPILPHLLSLTSMQEKPARWGYSQHARVGAGGQDWAGFVC